MWRRRVSLPLHDNGYIVGGIDGDPDAIPRHGGPHAGRAVPIAASLPPWTPASHGTWSCADVFGAPTLDYMRGLLARMFAKATHAIALLDVPDERRRWMLHALAEIGATAIQIEAARR